MYEQSQIIKVETGKVYKIKGRIIEKDIIEDEKETKYYLTIKYKNDIFDERVNKEDYDKYKIGDNIKGGYYVDDLYDYMMYIWEFEDKYKNWIK